MKALPEIYQRSTYVPGFAIFHFLASSLLAKLATSSIRVKPVDSIQYP